MFYQTNREQPIVDNLYIESIWLLQCPTANRWEKQERKGIWGDNYHLFSTPATHYFSTLMYYCSLDNVIFIFNQTNSTHERILQTVNSQVLLFVRHLSLLFFFQLWFDQTLNIHQYIYKNHHYHRSFYYILYIIYNELSFIAEKAFKFKKANILPLSKLLRLFGNPPRAKVLLSF